MFDLVAATLGARISSCGVWAWGGGSLAPSWTGGGGLAWAPPGGPRQASLAAGDGGLRRRPLWALGQTQPCHREGLAPGEHVPGSSLRTRFCWNRDCRMDLQKPPATYPHCGSGACAVEGARK